MLKTGLFQARFRPGPAKILARTRLYLLFFTNINVLYHFNDMMNNLISNIIDILMIFKG